MRLKFAFIFFLGIGFMGAENLHAQLYQQWSYKFSNSAQYALDSNNTFYAGNVAVDEVGNSYLYAEDNGVTCLLKFNTQGHLVWRVDGITVTTPPGPRDAYNLYYWRGNLYYANISGITKFDVNGNVIWNWLGPNFQGGWEDTPQWLMDNAGDIIAAWQSGVWGQDTNTTQFLAKIDQNGSTLWQYSYSFSNSDTSLQNYNIVCDSTDNIYLSFSARIWQQPYPWINSQWLMKFSTFGNSLWSYSQTNFDDEETFTTEVRPDGNVWAFLYQNTNNSTVAYIFDSSGTFRDSLQLHSYYTPIYSNRNYRYYLRDSTLIKADSSLNVVSSAAFLNYDFDNLIYNGKYIYLVNLKSNEANQTEIFEYNYNCELIQTLLPFYGYAPGGVSSNPGLDSMGNLYLLSSDWSDSAKLYKFCVACVPNLSGRLYYDSNQNCQLDSNEHGISSRLIQVNPGPYYAVSNDTGFFALLLPPGNYNLTQVLPNYWNASCADTLNAVLDSLDTVSSGNLLGSYPTGGITDVQISIVGTEATPGSVQNIELDYTNVGTTIDSGWVQLSQENLFTFNQASPMFDSVSGNTFFWKYENLVPGQISTINIIMSVPTYLPAGYAYQYSCAVSPVINDVNPANNYDTLYGVILSSLDPNSKSCSVKNTTASGNLTDSSILTYNVAFQNTGTDTARTIVVVDTLDPKLDISSFRMVQSSIRNYQLCFVGPSILEWTFNNASLPDSATNMVTSQAFIKYLIAPKQNLSPGTTIFNSATIYFDFNPGVSTNTTVNYFEVTPTAINTPTGFEQSVTVYPNPMNNQSKIVLSNPTGLPTIASIYDVSGRLINTYSFGEDRDIVIARNSLASGLYLVEIKQQNTRIGVAKIVVE